METRSHSDSQGWGKLLYLQNASVPKGQNVILLSYCMVAFNKCDISFTQERQHNNQMQKDCMQSSNTM